jgi:precorrin-6A/cobalt-precorrin-6A reductase
VKPKRLLILGGTQEARELLAQATNIAGVETIASLAGRTRQPILPAQNTRIGGFGGVAGLTNYLREQSIDGLIDASHPFAGQISWNAAISASAVNIPWIRLVRPAWEKTAGDRWIEVDSYEKASKVLPGIAKRVFLSIGRQELAVFASLQEIWFLLRMIDPPQPHALIPHGQLILERGSFGLAAERSLLRQYQIEAIVSKNSGGTATYSKIIAARELGCPVVMVQRPPGPEGEQVTDVEGAVGWLRNWLLE